MLCYVMLCYVEDIHLELHDNIPEGVHFVAETAFVKGLVSVESSVYVCSFWPPI